MSTPVLANKVLQGLALDIDDTEDFSAAGIEDIRNLSQFSLYMEDERRKKEKHENRTHSMTTPIDYPQSDYVQLLTRGITLNDLVNSGWLIIATEDAFEDIDELKEIGFEPFVDPILKKPYNELFTYRGFDTLTYPNPAMPVDKIHIFQIGQKGLAQEDLIRILERSSDVDELYLNFGEIEKVASRFKEGVLTSR